MVLIDVPRHQVGPDQLREALAGRVSGLPASVALAQVGHTGLAAEEQHELLRSAARDSALDPQVRAAAALRLFRTDPGSARAAATELLDDPSDDRVAGVAAAALGRFGDAEDVSRLRDVAASTDSELVRARATFARTLIIHRHGLADEESDLGDVDAEDPPGAGALPFDAVTPGARRRQRAIDGVRAELPDAADDDAYVAEIQCGPRLLEVVVRDAARGAAGVERLGRAPSLTAVVAALNEETEEFYPSLLALTRPAGGDGVQLWLTRPSGEPVYTGRGTLRDGLATFTIQAVRAFGSVPVDGRVRLGDGFLEISGTSERRGRRKRVPQRASAPDTTVEEE
ncbi:HEAT repeat domain-containing protein [Cellulomonas cellasea]|uniref:HEAT repeat domain-containing protein n=1 Tax=Cellulomonas cellasea TaxID=43670 RepID=A0A7W4UFL5_9CELL|nr:HEAT repeat domain-containing protein [Cellulomonas cellasea]MBB2923281.1 hypothetical protein [Cellulomonas cellasea]